MQTVLVLGAGFGGLELSTRLSAEFGEDLRVVLVDRAEGFTFGFSKLEVAFHGASPEGVRLPYAELAHPGVEFRQEEVLSIDPATRHVTTDAGGYDPDVLVVALGADYAHAATPGFVDDGWEFYTIDGARRLWDRLQDFGGGRVLISVLSIPFKCPPAPYEGAFLLDELLRARGVRSRSQIHFVTPQHLPIPVSPDASAAIVESFTSKGIELSTARRVRGLDPAQHVASSRAGELPYDLFIGVPTHRAPDVVVAAGLTGGDPEGWVPVDPTTFETRYPGVHAIGDCADASVPRAGVFAEAAARVLASVLTARLRGREPEDRFLGQGVCYIEMGEGRVGRVDADFLSGPQASGPYTPPDLANVEAKRAFGADRRRRWFGLD